MIKTINLMLVLAAAARVIAFAICTNGDVAPAAQPAPEAMVQITATANAQG